MLRSRVLSRPTRFEHVPVGGRIARPVERRRHLGFDDRNRRAQLMGGIGGEFYLPPADQLRGCGGPKTHDRRTHEHGDGQEQAEDQLRHQHVDWTFDVAGLLCPATSRASWPRSASKRKAGPPSIEGHRVRPPVT